eukprot:1157043-Pelagomonas_calceolata.AAC.4
MEVQHGSRISCMQHTWEVSHGSNKLSMQHTHIKDQALTMQTCQLAELATGAAHRLELVPKRPFCTKTLAPNSLYMPAGIFPCTMCSYKASQACACPIEAAILHTGASTQQPF